MNKELTIDVSFFGVLIVFYSYFMGWQYAENYYSNFGLTVSQLGFTYEEVARFGYSIAKYIVPTLFAIFLFVRVARRHLQSIWIFVICTAIVIPMSLYLPKRLAENLYKNVTADGFEDYRNIYFDSRNEDDDYANEYAKGCFKLLHSNENRMFLFVPNVSSTDLAIHIFETASIKNYILAKHGGCA